MECCCCCWLLRTREQDQVVGAESLAAEGALELGEGGEWGRDVLKSLVAAGNEPVQSPALDGDSGSSELHSQFHRMFRTGS